MEDNNLDLKTLQIGNLLHESGRIVRVQSLKTTFFLGGPPHYVTTTSNDQINGSAPSSFDGILLSDDWLGKLKFNKYKDAEGRTFWQEKNDNFKVYSSEESGYRINEYPQLGVKYLHQLQNLFFMIAGYEMNLPPGVLLKIANSTPSI